VPGLTNAFVFVPQLVLYRPWTLVTYMFLHGSLTHIGFNMLALFFFGPRVESVLGSKRFATLYFISGLSGALLSFPVGAPIIGASAGVFGVTLAFAYFWPDTPILIWGVFPVPAKILVILTGLMAFWSGFGGLSRGIAHFAHLGGYAGAYLYLKWLHRARGTFKKKATAPPAEAKHRLEKWKSIDRTKIHAVNKEEVNRILDKISASGLGSLTPEERLFLSNFVPTDDKVSPIQ
jgi:membrane associated rhomboid family serine protease